MNMKLVRQVFRSKRFIGLTAFIFCAVVFLFIFTGETTKPWYYGDAPCKQSANFLSDTGEALRLLHADLDEQSVRHFLCYGSLWGLLREHKLPPWDRSSDVCAIVTEHVTTVNTKKLEDAGFSSEYSHLHGIFTLKYKEARLTITLFEYIKVDGDIEDCYHRTGIRNKLLPPSIRIKFPTRLLLKPLAKLPVLGMEFPVPNEDYEIQKYLYANDWWDYVKPPNC